MNTRINTKIKQSLLQCTPNLPQVTPINLQLMSPCSLITHCLQNKKGEKKERTQEKKRRGDEALRT